MLCPHGTDPTMILLYKDEFMLFSLQPWNVPKASCIHQSKTAWVLRAAQEMTLGGETLLWALNAWSLQMKDQLILILSFRISTRCCSEGTTLLNPVWVRYGDVGLDPSYRSKKKKKNFAWNKTKKEIPNTKSGPLFKIKILISFVCIGP